MALTLMNLRALRSQEGALGALRLLGYSADVLPYPGEDLGLEPGAVRLRSHTVRIRATASWSELWTVPVVHSARWEGGWSKHSMTSRSLSSAFGVRGRSGRAPSSSDLG